MINIMKKATLLLALILISTIGFSQNKQGGNDPISGIDIIVKCLCPEPPDCMCENSKPQIPNPTNDPLIVEINALEYKYRGLRAKQIRVEFNSTLKENINKESVLKKYASFLQKGINIHSSSNNISTKSTGWHCRVCGDAKPGCCCGPDGPIPGIDDIIPIVYKASNFKNEADYFLQPISNSENEALIGQLNELERKYLNIRQLNLKKGFEVRVSQKKKNKSNTEIFNAYIDYVKNEIKRIESKSISQKNAIKKAQGVYVEEIVKFPPKRKKIDKKTIKNKKQ
jgi:hypothetical protein